MPLIQPDFSDLDKPIEPGTYTASITDVDVVVSKAGNPGIKPTLEINDNGTTRTRANTWVSVTGKGAFMFERLLRAAGFDDEANRIMAGERIEFDTDKLIGHEILVNVEN